MLNINNNPWLGLASYEYEDAYRFFGREKELERLKDCISNNLITTIYGISGSGKTSLINAGMCPLIEKENYLPVRIRMEHGSSKSYSEQIIKAVGDAIAKAGGEIETLEVFETLESIPENERLWLFFYTSTFWSATNHHLFPVVFIDQFEEIFTKNEDEEIIRTFFEGVSSLQYDNPPAFITQMLESREGHSSLNVKQNFRIVIIMREDFLARLEDYAYDSPALRKNRVGIKRMNGNQALQVITAPQPDLVSRDVALSIIAKVAGREIKDSPAFLEQLSVDTSLLSLFCSEVYTKAAEQKLSTITPELIDQFGEDILASFYINTMKLVPKQTAGYLETHLLTRSGFRNTMAMEDILADGILKTDLDKLCAKRLIRIETSDGTERVEFTHDVLCAIAKEHRNKALEKTSRRQSNMRTIGFLIDLALPLMVVLPSIFHLYLNHTPNNFLGIEEVYKQTILMAVIGFLVLPFNTVILLPYRHYKDRNAIFNAFLTFLFSNFAILFIMGIASYDGDYFAIMLVVCIVYFLIIFLNSFRFNRKRSFKEALDYTFHCKVYNEYPEMLTILKVAALVILLFVSFLVGISMNIKSAYISTPICSLLAFWLLLDLFGQSVRFDKKAILCYATQSVLILAMLRAQFNPLHLFITCVCLVSLLSLTISYIHDDFVYILRGKRIRNMLLIWLIAFTILPLVNLGYNPFRFPKYQVVKNGLIKDYKIARFLIVEDAHHKQGVRDRWNIVIPVENDSIDCSVSIDLDRKTLSGFTSLERYNGNTENDIVFTKYNNGEKEEWRCSEHLDMHNEPTNMIIQNATASDDNMKQFISEWNEVLEPSLIQYTMESYIRKGDKETHIMQSELAFFTLFSGDFTKAEMYARESINADPSYTLAYTNLFDALFLQDKLGEAASIFEEHKHESINSYTFKDGIIGDFDDLIHYGVIEESKKTDLIRFLEDK